MRISVFGLGYVGCVSAACFCELGHEVYGIDIDPAKVDFLSKGKSPIIEDQLPELLARHAASRRLRASTSVLEAIQNSDLSLICVGTPSLPSGALNTEYVERVSEQIGDALRTISHPHTVVVRSTLLPGTTREKILPRLESHSGKQEGKDFHLAYNPEFLREGSAIKDFFEPPKTVVGADRKETAEAAARIYGGIKAPVFLTRMEEAELVKYADNAFHAVKVVFGNEIGAIARELRVDSHRVMEIFCHDTKLNLSPYYLKPGFAFGGSCLPKDVRALTARARELNVETPMLFSLMNSNAEHVKRAVKTVIGFGRKRIGVLGLAFKAGTDDLRESPVVELVETLLGKGYDIKILDRNVSLARLIGSNKKFIEGAIPHLAQLLCEDGEALLDHAETLIVTYRDREFEELLSQAGRDKIIYDLVRVWKDEPQTAAGYHGIGW